MKFLLTHTTYNIITFLKSLKFSYINSLYTRPCYLIKNTDNLRKLTVINVILKLSKMLYRRLKIEYILEYYASNKQLKIENLLSKYLQSYEYFLRKENNFYFNISTNITQIITSPLHLIGLQSLYITYKILQSKHPIYIFYKINKIS